MSAPIEVLQPTPDLAATATIPDTPAVDDENPPETVAHWKKLSRSHEARSKANAGAAIELQEYKDRELSELERSQKAASASAAELADLRRQNTLLAKGIPLDLIPPANASGDELMAYADRLLEWRGTPVAAPVVSGPRPDLSQGARPLDATATEEAQYLSARAQLIPNRRR